MLAEIYLKRMQNDVLHLLSELVNIELSLEDSLKGLDIEYLISECAEHFDISIPYPVKVHSVQDLINVVIDTDIKDYFESNVEI